MRQQQDKEFDGRLGEKMRDFSATPPAGLWNNIDREINGPAVSPEKRSYGWLKVAASICLLAAAGFWIMQYRGPFEQDVLSVNTEQDSVSRAKENGVRVFNNSRSRAGTPGRSGADTGTAATAGQPATGASGPKASGPKASGAGPAGASGTKQMPADAKSEPVPAGETRPGGETIPAGDTQPAEEATPIQAIDSDVTKIAQLAAPAGVRAELKRLAAAAVPPAENGTAPRGELSTDGAATGQALAARGDDPAQGGRGKLFPRKLIEVSGIDQALDAVTAAFEGGGDGLLGIAKTDRSGKWEGVQLDLGPLTISYNKPTKEKTDTNKN